MATRLKPEIVKQIESDPALFALVAKPLKIKPISLTQLFKRKSARVREYDVLKAISDFTGTPIENLLGEIAEDMVSQESES